MSLVASPLLSPTHGINKVLHGSPRRRSTPKRLLMIEPSEEVKVDQSVDSAPYSVNNPLTLNINLAFLGQIESIDHNNTSIRPLVYAELQAKTIASLCLLGNNCFYNYSDSNFKCRSKKVSGASKRQIVEWLVAFFYQLYLQRHGGASVGAPRPVANSNEFRECESLYA
jgi:hypothetical protein